LEKKQKECVKGRKMIKMEFVGMRDGEDRE
jgi:hypothetical protein